MKYLIKNIILLLSIIASSQAIGQNVSVTAKLDTGAMLIGDHVGLTISFTGPAKAQVLWPFIPDTILGNIQVIGRGKIDTAFSTDKLTATYKQFLNLTCYDSGFYNIPSIPFRFRNLPDTNQNMALSDQLMLAVHTLPVDTTKAIKPIKGIMKIPISFREMLPWILAGLALVAIILGVIWYIRKRRKNEPVFRLKPRVVLSPQEKALQELEKLRVKKLWQSGKLKEYYTELTDILRVYIEDNFRVPAMEQTTSEIMDTLAALNEINQEPLSMLNQILSLADMVKFARGHPLPSENDQSLELGISFIQAGFKNGPGTGDTTAAL
jgi:hypothetical protein